MFECFLMFCQLEVVLPVQHPTEVAVIEHKVALITGSVLFRANFGETPFAVRTLLADCFATPRAVLLSRGQPEFLCTKHASLTFEHFDGLSIENSV